MSQSRYARQTEILMSSGGLNEALGKASVLICGVGGLGCPAALYLAAAGVGQIGLIDCDTVSTSNLNRQILYHPADLGKPKTETAKERLLQFNPDIRIDAYQEKITSILLKRLLPLYNVVLDCTDDYETRKLIAQSAYKNNLPTVVAGVSKLEGFVLTVKDSNSACLGCLYTKTPVITGTPQVLGAAAGVVGSLAAAQTILLLTGRLPDANLLLFDVAKAEYRSMKLEKPQYCEICRGKSDRAGN